MKKISAILIAAALLFGALANPLASTPAQAASDSQEPQASAARVTRPEPQAARWYFKLFLPVRVSTFQVNEHMPVFKCTAAITRDEYEPDRITQVTITEAESGALVQNIDLTTEYIDDAYEIFMKSPVYFIDVTFDGNLDLLISHQWCARYISFGAFFWDEKSQQFRQDPDFPTLYNPAIDPVNKFIYTTIQGDSMTSYSVRTFTNNHFVTTNNFSSNPEGPNGVGNIHYREYRRNELTGEETLVNDFHIDTDDFYGPAGYDDADPLLKPYFKPGSFWDLRSDKWRSALWQEFIY